MGTYEIKAYTIAEGISTIPRDAHYLQVKHMEENKKVSVIDVVVPILIIGVIWGGCSLLLGETCQERGFKMFIIANDRAPNGRENGEILKICNEDPNAFGG